MTATMKQTLFATVAALAMTQAAAQTVTTQTAEEILAAQAAADRSLVFRTSPSPLAPYDRGQGHIVTLGADADPDYVIGKAGFGATLFDGERDTVSVWGEGFRGFALDAGEEFFGGSIGPMLRSRLDAENAVGIGLFLDAGAGDDADDILAQGGVSVEYERMLDLEAVATLRLGANGYAPFEDYTETATFGALERAPQLGGDVYAMYGRDIANGDARYDFMVGGFGYAEGDEAETLYGAVATLGLTVWAGLPEGLAVNGYVGPRYTIEGGSDSDELEIMGGLGLSYAFGGETRGVRSVSTQPRYDAPRDCVVSRDRDGRAVYDCRRPVVQGAGGGAKTGEFVREVIPAPQPTVTQVETTLPGTAPVKPIRHIGFRSPFTPIAR